MDGVNIQGYTNQQAVEVLRHTGQTVHLKLIRRDFRADEEEPPIVTPVVSVLSPSATIPTTATIMKELALEERIAEQPAQGREKSQLLKNKETKAKYQS